MHADKELHPPLQVWKLALLLLSTATLYQFVWLHRSMEDVRAARIASITPWHWSLIPLLGPFAVIPGSKMAGYLRDWQVDEDKEIGYFAEPVMVGMFILIAYLPFAMLIVNVELIFVVLVVSSLLLCLTYLILQGQMNRLKAPVGEQQFTTPSWRFAKHQLWAMAIGCLAAIPLYAITFTNVRENLYAADLVPEEAIGPDAGFYQVRIQDAGWSRAGVGEMTVESDLYLYGPDDFTWAVVYDSSGQSVDSILSFRISAIREDFSRATCSQRKSVIEDGWIVEGELECSGRTPIDGDYVFAARVLRKDQEVVEILASTSQRNPERFEELSGHVRRLVGGLEMVR